MAQVKTVAEWLAERGISLAELVEASRLGWWGRLPQDVTRPARSSASVFLMPWGSARSRSPGDTWRRSNTFTATARSSAAPREEASPAVQIQEAMMATPRNLVQLCTEHGI